VSTSLQSENRKLIVLRIYSQMGVYKSIEKVWNYLFLGYLKKSKETS